MLKGEIILRTDNAYLLCVCTGNERSQPTRRSSRCSASFRAAARRGLLVPSSTWWAGRATASWATPGSPSRRTSRNNWLLPTTANTSYDISIEVVLATLRERFHTILQESKQGKFGSFFYLQMCPCGCACPEIACPPPSTVPARSVYLIFCYYSQ